MFLANNDNLFFESFCMLKCVVWDGFLGGQVHHRIF
jgi:hypothetical protein